MYIILLVLFRISCNKEKVSDDPKDNYFLTPNNKEDFEYEYLDYGRIKSAKFKEYYDLADSLTKEELFEITMDTNKLTRAYALYNLIRIDSTYAKILFQNAYIDNDPLFTHSMDFSQRKKFTEIIYDKYYNMLYDDNNSDDLANYMKDNLIKFPLDDFIDLDHIRKYFYLS
jgi:hypothetical protein